MIVMRIRPVLLYKVVHDLTHQPSSLLIGTAMASQPWLPPSHQQRNMEYHGRPVANALAIFLQILYHIRRERHEIPDFPQSITDAIFIVSRCLSIALETPK